MKIFLKFFVLGFLLVGCVSTPRTQDIPVANTTHIIYVIYRGWHTSILLDANLLSQNPQLANDLSGQKFARVGWGDGDYFTGKNKSSASAAKALVASGYSAVQLLAYDVDPFGEIPPDTIVPVAVTDRGMHQLVDYINNSIAVDEQGKLVRLPSFGEATGSFFQSRDHYSVFSNCNTWSGNALRAAGLPVANRLTAQGVFEQVTLISHFQAGYGLFKTRY